MRKTTTFAMLISMLAFTGCQERVGEQGHGVFALTALRGSAPAPAPAVPVSAANVTMTPVKGLAPGKGELSVDVSPLLKKRQRELLATYADVTAVTVTLFGPNQERLTLSLSKAQLDAGQTSASFSDLAPGSWSYKVEAMAGTVSIGTMTGGATVGVGQNTTVAVSLVLVPTPVQLPTPTAVPTTEPPVGGGGNPPTTGSLSATVSIEDGATEGVLPALPLPSQPNASEASNLKPLAPGGAAGCLVVGPSSLWLLDGQGAVVDTWTVSGGARIYDASFSADGSLWAILDGSTVVRFVPHSHTVVTMGTFALPSLYGALMYAAPDGGVWVPYYGYNLMARFGPDGVPHTFDMEAFNYNNPAQGMAFDAAGNAYMTSGGGVIEKVSPDGLTHADIVTGTLPAGLPVVDEEGHLWVVINEANGTFTLGKYAADGTKLGSYALVAGMVDRPRQLLADGHGHVVVCWEGGQLERHAIATGERLGLYLPDGLTGGPSALYTTQVDPAGNVWIANGDDNGQSYRILRYRFP